MAYRHRQIVITSFGDRPHTKTLIERLERLTTLPIWVLSESNCQTFWPGHPRWGVRNSNLAKAQAVFDAKLDTTLLILDDDMIPVSPQFIQGFDLAEQFGLCLPMNPRQYAGLNAQVGADMSAHVKHSFMSHVPYNLTAVNLGVMYVKISFTTRDLFRLYLSLLRQGMRGTSAMDWAIWKTGICPHILSPLWCCCGSDAYWHTTTSRKIKIPPVFLHGGHQAVCKWFESDPYFEEYR